MNETNTAAQTSTDPQESPQVEEVPEAPKAKTTKKRSRAPKPKDPMVAVNKIIKGLPTTSARIRALDAKGYTRSQIAKVLDKRYQHVRNVLITPVKAPKS